MNKDFSLWKREQDSIAQGCLTNSKSPKSFVFGVYPTHALEGSGEYLTGDDKKKYLDFICGLGANFIGYGNPKLSRELEKHLSKGFSHSLPTPYEIEAAEAVKSIIPFIEKVKFLKTGSEACSAAVRIARAYRNQRKKTTTEDLSSFLVLSQGYHGWADNFSCLTPPAWGVPRKEWLRVDDLNPELAEAQIASADCVIIEPVITDYSDARGDWLRELRRLCTKHETLLIFDEVITGFRFKKFSVSRYFRVEPDLICCGKAVGGGLPLSFVGGRRDLMDCEYFVSSTYAGEILSLAACKYIVGLLQSDKDYSIDRLWEAGEEFLADFNQILPDRVRIEGYPTRGAFKGDDLSIALFFQESAKAGILYCKSWFLNFPMVPHLKDVLQCSREILNNIKHGRVELEGRMPESPYAQRVRENAR